MLSRLVWLFCRDCLSWEVRLSATGRKVGSCRCSDVLTLDDQGRITVDYAFVEG
jgi:hypothetical protein